jgi:hypothetical protein
MKAHVRGSDWTLTHAIIIAFASSRSPTLAPIHQYRQEGENSPELSGSNHMAAGRFPKY